jgi:hypothetical protein
MIGLCILGSLSMTELVNTSQNRRHSRNVVYVSLLYLFVVYVTTVSSSGYIETKVNVMNE